MTNPITQSKSCYRMNTAQFNGMLHAARAMVAAYHDGTKFDEQSIRWAQTLVDANPTDKRRPSPMRDAILALFEGKEAAGLRRDEIAAGLPTEVEPGNLVAVMYDLTKREPVHLWIHRPRGDKWGRYYPTKQYRDAAADAEASNLAVALEAKAKERSARLDKNAAAKAARAAAKEAAKTTKVPKQTAEKHDTAGFNGTSETFKARVAKLATPKDAPNPRSRINPDQGLPWVEKPKAEIKPTIPAGLKVQYGPSYTHDPRVQCAPNEKPFGAGFSALPIGYSPVTGRPW
jgi:hypothetical protein